MSEHIQVYDGRGNLPRPRPYQFAIDSQGHVEFHRDSNFNTKPGYRPDLMRVERYVSIIFNHELGGVPLLTLKCLEDIVTEHHVLDPLVLCAKWADNIITYTYGMARIRSAKKWDGINSVKVQNVLHLEFTFNGETNEDAVDRWDGMT